MGNPVKTGAMQNPVCGLRRIILPRTRVNSVGWAAREVSLLGDQSTPMGLQRWFYAGGRPNRVARILDRCTAALSARGSGPEYLVTLEVPGRRSGRIVALPLVMAVVGGERYLVSMLGEEVNWVRNVKAAGGDVALRHGPREEVRLEEVAPDQRAPVLKAYLKRAPNARAHLPIDKDAPLAEFERVSPRYPVFRVARRNTG